VTEGTNKTYEKMIEITHNQQEHLIKNESENVESKNEIGYNHKMVDQRTIVQSDHLKKWKQSLSQLF
jgi:hypothetical protein